MLPVQHRNPDSQKLTPWFPGDVKPVHEGVYQRDFDSGCYGFSKFNGSRWILGFPTPDEAVRVTIVSPFQSLPWRGLAQDPSKESH